MMICLERKELATGIMSTHKMGRNTQASREKHWNVNTKTLAVVIGVLGQ